MRLLMSLYPGGTNRCENITLPQTSFASGNKSFCFVELRLPPTMESVLFISRFFRRLITRIRGCLLHTAPVVCRHCSTSGGVNATLAEAVRRGHVECVKACLTAGADVNTKGSAPGELKFKSFPWGVFMFKYFPWCVLIFEYFPWVWDLLMFKYFPWCVYLCTTTSQEHVVYLC